MQQCRTVTVLISALAVQRQSFVRGLRGVGLPSVVVLFSVGSASGQDGSLDVEMTASPDPVAPGGQVVYQITVANRSSGEAENVDVRSVIPSYTDAKEDNTGGNCDGFDSPFACNAGETIFWDLGDLAAGQSTVVSYAAQVRTGNEAPPEGAVLNGSATATSFDGGGVSASADVVVDSSPSVLLSMAGSKSPVAPGEEQTYTLTYSVPGEESLSDASLQAAVPSGASFVSATGDETVSGGQVEWDLGTLPPGTGGKKTFTVEVNSELENGRLLTSEAEIQSGSHSARGEAVTAVHAGPPVALSMTASPDPVAPGGQVVYQITVTNRSSETAEDVYVNSVIPSYTDAKEDNTGGECDGIDNPYACNAGETIAWEGDLQAGESAVVSYAAQVRTGNEAPPEGTVLDGSATAGSSFDGGASASADVVVDSSPSVLLSMAGSKSPVAPGEEQTYTLTYSVPGEESLSDASLQAAVPSGASFVSATGDETVSGGQVEWDLGTLPPGTGGKKTFTVEVNSELENGRLLTSEAEIQSGSHSARGEAVTAVHAGPPVALSMTASPDPVAPGGQVVYQITVTNRSSETAENVDVRSVIPSYTDAKEDNTGGGCDGIDNPYACNAGETIAWDVGDLQAGESAVVSYAAQVRTGNEAPPEGTVLDGSATAGSSFDGGASASADVIFGTMDDGNDPAAPTGLAATSAEGQVSLSWEASDESELSGYNVYRSPDTFSAISKPDVTKRNTTLLSDPNYTDTDVEGGTTYYYRVTAVDSDGNESALSGQVSTSLQNLQLLGLEVNQSVQTWENDIMPLVEGKKTIVRAHLQNKGEVSTPVRLKLKGTQNGSRLPGSPKSAFNADSYEAPPSPSEDSVETIRQRRAHMDSTLNFGLPSEWLEGTVTLQLLGDGIDCDETPAVNADCQLQVTFEPTGIPKITFFRVAWNDGEGNTHLPDIDETDIESVSRRVKNMYPTNKINISLGDGIVIPCYKIFRSCRPPDKDGLLLDIKNRWIEDLGDNITEENHIYVGFVSEVEEDWAGAAINKVAFVSTDEDKGYDQATPSATAHELGHILGRPHAVNEENPLSEEGNLMGWCGAEATPPAANFPYESDRVEIPEELLEESTWTGFAALGPTDQGLENEVWGVDMRAKEVIATSKYTSGGANGELMSYCNDNLYNLESKNIGPLWTSDATYTLLRDAINARFNTAGEPALAAGPPRSRKRASALTMSSQQEEEYLLVRGQINLAEDSLQFRSFSTIITTPNRADAIAPESGDYTLQALDGSGSVVEEVSFEPSIGVSKTVSNIGTFTIPIQNGPSIEEVQVLGGEGENSLSNKSGPGASANNNVLGSKTASQSPPTVTVQYPNGGEDLTGGEVILRWTADDPDGDSLSYTVKYSRNGGSTWKALATSWPRDSLTVDASTLGGTSNGLIRVQASDGFNTAEDESDGTFGTANVPPSASIFSPSDGAVIGQSGLLTLDGSGSDTEDGSLSGSALKWQTASGDSLGNGETIDVPADNFSLGAHTIELVATDSFGASDTASVSIQVALSNDPSLVAGASVLVETDTLHDFGATGAAINFASTSGAATVTVERYGSAPIGTRSIPQRNVSDYRILINAGEGLEVGPGTEVRFEVGTLGGIGDPAEVQIYRRPAPSNGPFTALDTQVDDMDTPGDPSDDAIYATVPGFGEFVFASDSQPLPVELSGFDATVDGDDTVRLTWTTASETNNAGFRVQRKAGEESGGTWTTVGSVDGSGTTSESKRYRYVDDNLPYEADRLTYRLKQVDTDGSSSYSKEVTVERSVTEVQLLGTYPNPAQQRATLRYAVPERQDVTLHLYDVLGRRVQTVVDGERKGRHTTQLDVSRLASGVYFLRLTAGGQIRTQKLTVVQ